MAAPLRRALLLLAMLLGTLLGVACGELCTVTAGGRAFDLSQANRGQNVRLTGVTPSRWDFELNACSPVIYVNGFQCLPGTWACQCQYVGSGVQYAVLARTRGDASYDAASETLMVQYTGGDYCEEPLRYRMVVIRFTCRENDTESLPVYAGEPMQCVYEFDWASAAGCVVNTTFPTASPPPPRGPDVLVAGGWFSGVTATWDGTAWTPLGQDEGRLSESVSALVVYNGALVAGGDFTLAGSYGASRTAHFDGVGWKPLGYGVAGTVRAAAVYGGELIVGGEFAYTAEGERAEGLARWDGSAWTGWTAGVNGNVHAMIQHDGALLAAINVYADLATIRAWDGAGWTELGTQLDGPVYALAAYGDGLLVAGGGFLTAGNGAVLVNSIAQWNGTDWSSLAGGLLYPTRTAQVYSLAVYQGDLIAGGQFHYSPERGPLHGVARWDGVAWWPLDRGAGWSPAHSSIVYAMVEVAGRSVVGGSFEMLRGFTGIRHVAQWNGTDWSALGTELDKTVRALVMFGDAGDRGIATRH